MEIARWGGNANVAAGGSFRLRLVIYPNNRHECFPILSHKSADASATHSCAYVPPSFRCLPSPGWLTGLAANELAVKVISKQPRCKIRRLRYCSLHRLSCDQRTDAGLPRAIASAKSSPPKATAKPPVQRSSRQPGPSASIIALPSVTSLFLDRSLLTLTVNYASRHRRHC